MPKLSIVVPVYNVEKYLNQCIDSILGQSFNDFELIIVDDGAKDNSGIICDEYAKVDSRVTVIHTENHGVVTARRTGLNCAKGEYTSFVDSDDWLDPDFYSDIFDALGELDTDAVICSFVSRSGISVRTTSFDAGYYDNIKLNNTVFPKMMYDMSEEQFHIIPSFWDKIFRTELLKNIYKGVDPIVTLGEDAVCSYPCIAKASSLLIIENKACYHYREDHISMVNNCDIRLLQRVCALAVNMNHQLSDISELFNKQAQIFISYNGLYASRQVLLFNREMMFHKRVREVRSFLTHPAIEAAFREARNTDCSIKLKLQLYFAYKKHPYLLALTKITYVAKKIKSIFKRG